MDRKAKGAGTGFSMNQVPASPLHKAAPSGAFRSATTRRAALGAEMSLGRSRAREQHEKTGRISMRPVLFYR